MDLSKSKKGLERYAENLGSEYVDFFVGLWDIQEGIEAVEWTPVNEETLLDAARAGTPLFTLESPTLASDYLYQNIAKVAEYIASKIEGFSATAKKINQVAQAGAAAPSLSSEALQHLFIDQGTILEELAQVYEIELNSNEFEYLRLALATVLEPTAHAAAAKIDVPAETNFTEALCPVCGSPSPLGTHRDAGTTEGSPRDMWCGLCGTVYRFPRICCTRCGNKRQDELNYNFAEGDDNHRIYTCSSCLGTQKIVQEQGLNYIPDPRAESLAMVELEEQVQEALYEAAEEHAEQQR